MGGKARAAKLMPERRKAIARQGALAKIAKKALSDGQVTKAQVSLQTTKPVQRCQASYCKELGVERIIDGLKCWLCNTHSPNQS